jgi:hypothetical protein
VTSTLYIIVQSSCSSFVPISSAPTDRDDDDHDDDREAAAFFLIVLVVGVVLYLSGEETNRARRR